MARWADVEAQAPELVALARRLLDAHVHKTLATIRRDGSPRISGSEVEFADGEMWLGSMWGAVKARDLQRDPRFALHSGSDDPPDWPGDAKVAGQVEEMPADPGAGGDERSHRFRCDVTELVVVRLNDARDLLVIESWHEDRGVTRRERR